MVHSLQPNLDDSIIDPSIDIIHPEGSSKTHFNQMSLYVITFIALATSVLL